MKFPQEYWREKTLFDIASHVSTPLTLDASIKNRVFGHYACILVNMDLLKCLFYEITVEMDGYAFLRFNMKKMLQKDNELL